ncbi:MAG: ARMT1-like domain-containing protein [Phycisphaerae bacterium]
MSHFCLLANPDKYVAQDWDLLADAAARERWLGLFETHFGETLKHAATQYGRNAGKQIATARQQFAQVLAGLRANPASLPSGKLNVLELCRAREKVLRDNRLNDPFAHIKTRENALAAKLYPQAVRKLHAMRGADKWLHLIECVFAGNIFDLGATATMHLAEKPTDFLAAVESTKPRPWAVDDFDRLARDLPDRPPTKWSKVIFFIDNAGSDFILGVMPLARELAMYGTKVVLAANELPSLNDMTADETVAVVERLAAADPDLAALVQAGMFEVVSTGNDTPLIDLSSVSDELNAAAADAELVVLEGMGRAVESNLNAEFKCDTLWLALLKDPVVAARIGGEIYDCVCKYRPAQS